ncbi:MAG TPA: glycosyltransferase [Chthoniobacterales bacterium]|jgi:glycosyltransferase involved in cell wall biosynthesis
MRILVASVRPPFIRGGAEVLADELKKALVAAGHEADLMLLPFNSEKSERIPDQMLACALMDANGVPGARVDRLITLKFPAYLLSHPNKVVWLLHQHREAYDLWDHPLGHGLRASARGTIVRDIIRRADEKMCSEIKALFTLSENVTRRVRRFWNVDSTPLYHPPAHAEAFYCADLVEDYFFFPSRLAANKRQELALQALALTRNPIRVKFAGAADSPPYGDHLAHLARRLGVESRVQWTGFVSEKEKQDGYAHAVAVLFTPFDEDYGYVTLEAMLSGKPVITCDDSGGPLEFVLPNETGLVASSKPDALAEAMDMLWEDRALAQTLGRAGRRHYEGLGLSWAKVVKSLLA